MSVVDQGTRLGGRYVLGASLGRGASAAVHDGWDELLQRPVAVKVLHPHADSHWSAGRFCEEARTAARLSSPHVVTVYDFGSDDEPYLVLERMSGRTWADELRDRARSGRPRSHVEDARSCEVLCAVLQALAQARELGVVHRDVKPGNVMLTDVGVPKLGDFGIAKSAGGDALTRTGEVLGSFAYVAPERASGEGATPASDIWSVGVMAYEAFTGVRPFTGDSAAAVVHAVLRGDHVPIDERRPDLPASIRAAVTSALSADPDQRPAPGAFAAALSQPGVHDRRTGATTAVSRSGAPPVALEPRVDAVANPALEPTAAFTTAGRGVAVSNLTYWRLHTGRTAALLTGGAAVLALVAVLASQDAGAARPADLTTPTPTATTPATTTTTTPTSTQPASRTSSSTVVQAPVSHEKAKPPPKGKAPKKHDKGKPHGKGPKK